MNRHKRHIRFIVGHAYDVVGLNLRDPQVARKRPILSHGAVEQPDKRPRSANPPKNVGDTFGPRRASARSGNTAVSYQRIPGNSEIEKTDNYTIIADGAAVAWRCPHSAWGTHDQALRW